MDALEAGRAWLGEIPADQWLSAFVAFCQDAYYSSAFRLVFYLTIVFATIWMIAKVYSGNLQNAERGPVAIRRHSTSAMSRDTLVVPRHLIDMSMDGVQARCTFMYVYDGHHGKRAHVKLLSRNMRLSVSASPLRSLQDVARGNEIPDVRTEEVFWPPLEPDTEAPTIGAATPENARDYAVQNRVLERWTGDDALSLISLHEEVMTEVRDARDEFIRDRVNRLRKAKQGSFIRRMSAATWARRRPGAVGNYYLKFQFSNDPMFVLTRHPDRDVRMTAWLTVLTSMFALIMELFPLQAVRPPDHAFTNGVETSASERARPPRVRPVRP